MLTDLVRPTTLEGLKRLAAQLKKERSLKHSDALDAAAKAAGYQNFRHAQRGIPRREASEHYVLATMYWSDSDNGYRCGRETLKIRLSRPLTEICEKRELKHLPGLYGFRLVAGDHLVSDQLARSKERARRDLCAIERSLRFMEHTGLKPARAHDPDHRSRRTGERLPWMDHTTSWLDLSNGQLVLIDEPYPLGPNQQDRADWSNATGWRVEKTSWAGMYAPCACELYVVTDGHTGYDVEGLVARINAMPDPAVADEWTGDSVSSLDTFLSPLAKSSQDARRARCRGTIYPAASATSVPYDFRMGTSQRRPLGEMGIPGHIHAGAIIKAVIRSKHRPWGAYTRMNSVRSTLEDWMSLEIGSEGLPGPEFFDVYYRETETDAALANMASSSAGIISMLEELEQKLRSSYSDCGALRKLLKRIDVSLILTRRMTTPAE